MGTYLLCSKCLELSTLFHWFSTMIFLRHWACRHSSLTSARASSTASSAFSIDDARRQVLGEDLPADGFFSTKHQTSPSRPPAARRTKESDTSAATDTRLSVREVTTNALRGHPIHDAEAGYPSTGSVGPFVQLRTPTRRSSTKDTAQTKMKTSKYPFSGALEIPHDHLSEASLRSMPEAAPISRLSGNSSSTISIPEAVAQADQKIYALCWNSDVQSRKKPFPATGGTFISYVSKAAAWPSRGVAGSPLCASVPLVSWNPPLHECPAHARELRSPEIELLTRRWNPIHSSPSPRPSGWYSDSGTAQDLSFASNRGMRIDHKAEPSIRSSEIITPTSTSEVAEI